MRLDPVESPAGGWVGLSEVTALPDGRLAVIERDNQLGQEARVKRIYAIDPASTTFVPHGEALPVLTKDLVRDVLDDLDDASVSTPDKVEGLGLTADGRVFMVTDNDGVDENYGETAFVGLGPGKRLF
ncbi:MAG: esterase-like activity of phytase family protein [Actinomycetota bacterium]|nr:esterase-like activity of phytase family protein [Actinomycetota bacterium]